MVTEGSENHGMPPPGILFRAILDLLYLSLGAAKHMRIGIGLFVFFNNMRR